MVYLGINGDHQKAARVLNDLEARRLIISVGTAGPTNHPHWWGKRWSVAPENQDQVPDDIPQLD